MRTLHTHLCDLIGIRVPIMQAGMGGMPPALVAAVSNAGGLGVLGLGGYEPDDVERLVAETRSLTDQPLGVNFVLDRAVDQPLEAALEAGVRVISLFWGDPSSYVERVHAAGGIVIHGVASAAEARRRRDEGVDVILAQGVEAGGHVWGTVTTLALVPRVVDAVAPTPVIAAGGIADGRGIAAVLMLGAQAACLGTRFLATAEAPTHAVYKRRLLEASETDTVYSRLFDIGWPNAPLRTLRNSTVEAWEKAGRPDPGERPGEGEVVARLGEREYVRYGMHYPYAGAEGDLEAMALYAGQGVGLVTDVVPAGELVQRLAAEARAALDRQ
jgi:NAD(P)H-dependent flavin oxidoreductase YrpB (nitropropane dioxygenase family)